MEKATFFGMTIGERKRYNLVISMIFLVLFLLYGALGAMGASFDSELWAFSQATPFWQILGSFLSFGMLGGWGFTSFVGGIWLGCRFIGKQGKGMIILACVFFMFTLQILWMIGMVVTIPFVIYNIVIIKRSPKEEVSDIEGKTQIKKNAKARKPRRDATIFDMIAFVYLYGIIFPMLLAYITGVNAWIVIFAAFALYGLYVGVVQLLAKSVTKEYERITALLADTLELTKYLEEMQHFITREKRLHFLSGHIFVFQVDMATAYAALGETDMAIKILKELDDGRKRRYEKMGLAISLCAVYLNKCDIKQAKDYYADAKVHYMLFATKSFEFSKKRLIADMGKRFATVDARFCLAAGDYEKALTSFTEIWETEELSNLQKVVLQFNLAKCYAGLEKEHERDACLQYVIDHGNEHHTVKLAREMLEKTK